MRKNLYRMQFLIPILLAMAGCGGGGGGGGGDGGSDGNGGGNGGGGNSPAMTMSCAEGAGHQCSGSDIIEREKGIALTRSGVQVYGKSTEDDITTASGLALASKGTADIRVRKSGGTISNAFLLLSDMEISWNGSRERPIIIETFNSSQGRNELSSEGTVESIALPEPSNLDFYDYASLAQSATQGNYANNRYFPRDEPSRCDSGDCPMIETDGLSNDSSDGLSHASADRLHGDGDVHAGTDRSGEPIVGGNGVGVPFPGSKGYRTIDNWSYQYGNLAAWLTQDTVEIAEWMTTSGVEHNQNRRGMVAYGDVTAPSSVPGSGSVTYYGTVRGWYEPGSGASPNFSGTAAITVDFASRIVSLNIEGIPTGAINVDAKLGDDGSDNANYFTGSVDGGGLSGRLFGPASGSSTPEIGGVFSLPGDSPVIGGFIARRQ